MPDAVTAPAAAGHPGRLPGTGPMLAGQVGYQLRLLARTPRALWFGVFAPAAVLALRLGRISHPGGHTAISPAAEPESASRKRHGCHIHVAITT